MDVSSALLSRTCLVVLCLLAAAARADTWTSMAEPVPTVDLATVSLPVVVDAGFEIADVNAIVTLAHEAVHQIHVRLRHPDGTAVLLFEGLNGSEVMHMVLDDEAAARPAPGGAPYTGAWIPAQGLDAFDGKPAQGTWTLEVEDSVPGRVGTVRSITLAFNGRTFVAGGMPMPIPDFALTTSTLPVGQLLSVADADVTLWIDHVCTDDLLARLVAPGGAAAQLAFKPPGCAGSWGLQGTSFDDESPFAIEAAPPPFRGRFHTTPDGQLLDVDGVHTAGTWKLEIEDFQFEDAGVLRAWSLHVVPAGPCVDVGASAQPYGSGVAGTLGVPTLTPVFTPMLGQAFQLQVSNTLGAPQQGALFIGLQQAALPGKGGTLLVQPLLLVPFTIFNPVGQTFLAFLPPDAALCGQHLYVQSLQKDPGAPKGVAFSSGLELVFGS